MAGITQNKDGSLSVDYTFKTMNNKTDISRLSIEAGECAAIVNTIPTSKGYAYQRKGYTRISSTPTYHAWSNGSDAYFVQNDILHYFDGATTTAITSVSPSNISDYVQVNNVVIFSNGIDYLVLDKALLITLETPTEEYKTQPIAGTSLEFYNGRVYIAKDNTLYCTDTFNVGQMDIRQCVVASYEDNITMIRRVDDGIYVSTTNELFFLQADEPTKSEGYNQELLANTGCIPGTVIRTNGDAFPVAQMKGSLIVFSTNIGVFVCGNGGTYSNLSFDKVSYNYADSGASIYFDFNGEHYYLTSFAGTNAAINQFTIPSFEVDTI